MIKLKMLSKVVVLSTALIGLCGCPKKTEYSAMQVEPESTAQSETVAATVEPDPASGSMSKPGQELSEKQPFVELKPVFFDFDQAVIRNEEKAVLEDNAAWLKANAGGTIIIAGNCDDRGTREYNLALGQRRADSVRKYLTALGVPAGRISLISYGKEKPLCTEESEECMQQNRRGDIVVNYPVVSALP